MDSRKEGLVSQFAGATMKEFYERFTTPELRENAFDVLEKSQKITDQAMKHLNDALAKHAAKQAPAPLMKGPFGRDAGAVKQETNWQGIAKAQRQFARRTHGILAATKNQLGRVAPPRQQQQQPQQQQWKSRRRPQGKSLSEDFDRGR